MQVDSYESRVKPFTSILVPAGADADALVPATIKAQFGPFILRKQYDLQPTDHRLALNVPEALKELEAKGYYLAQAKAEITVRDGGPNGPVIERRTVR